MLVSDTEKIFETLLDPRINVGTITFDGATFVRMQIGHPRHGPIEIMMPMATAQQVGSLLLKAADDVAETRKARE